MKTLSPIFDQIIHYVGHSPNTTVKAIMHDLKKKDIERSQAQIYNIVKALLDKRILTKHNGLLSLNAQWIQELQQFTHMIMSNHEENIHLKTHQEKVYTASSFYELNSIRSDLSSRLIEQEMGNLYYYDPHPYHILGQQQYEKTDLQKFLQKKSEIYYLIGHDNFLDRYGSDLLRTQGCIVTTTNKSTFKKNTFLASVGDYLYQVQIADSIYQYFELFFANTTTIQDFNQELFSSIFHMKGTCTLTLKRDASKARKLREKIQACMF